MKNTEFIMGINENAIHKITQRLTDLYRNPIEATVREIVSNAIDTTIRSNSDEPINIIAPTELNPELIVIDKGEGMSLEEVETIYSQYGASTKVNDNTMTGAFGLGAKAPLSYCSKFIVETTKDGVTTEVYLTSDEEGNFAEIVSSENIGKTDGTIVSIPVMEDDIYKFDRIVNTYKNYNNGVNFIFNDELNKRELDPLIGTIEVDGRELPLYLIRNKIQSSELQSLLKLYFSHDSYILEEIIYLLSGWPYEKSNYGGDTIYLGMKPGLVNFSSSRDEITKDDKFKKFNEEITPLIKKAIEGRINELLTGDCTNSMNEIIDYTSERYKISLNDGVEIKNLVFNGTVTYNGVEYDANEVWEELNRPIFTGVFGRSGSNTGSKLTYGNTDYRRGGAFALTNLSEVKENASNQYSLIEAQTGRLATRDNYTLLIEKNDDGNILPLINKSSIIVDNYMKDEKLRNGETLGFFVYNEADNEYIELFKEILDKKTFIEVVEITTYDELMDKKQLIKRTNSSIKGTLERDGRENSVSRYRASYREEVIDLNEINDYILHISERGDSLDTRERIHLSRHLAEVNSNYKLILSIKASNITLKNVERLIDGASIVISDCDLENNVNAKKSIELLEEAIIEKPLPELRGDEISVKSKYGESLFLMLVNEAFKVMNFYRSNENYYNTVGIRTDSLPLIDRLMKELNPSIHIKGEDFRKCLLPIKFKEVINDELSENDMKFIEYARDIQGGVPIGNYEIREARINGLNEEYSYTGRMLKYFEDTFIKD